MSYGPGYNHDGTGFHGYHQPQPSPYDARPQQAQQQMMGQQGAVHNVIGGSPHMRQYVSPPVGQYQHPGQEQEWYHAAVPQGIHPQQMRAIQNSTQSLNAQYALQNQAQYDRQPPQHVPAMMAAPNQQQFTSNTRVHAQQYQTPAQPTFNTPQPMQPQQNFLPSQHQNVQYTRSDPAMSMNWQYGQLDGTNDIPQQPVQRRTPQMPSSDSQLQNHQPSSMVQDHRQHHQYQRQDHHNQQHRRESVGRPYIQTQHSSSPQMRAPGQSPFTSRMQLDLGNRNQPQPNQHTHAQSPARQFKQSPNMSPAQQIRHSPSMPQLQQTRQPAASVPSSHIQQSPGHTQAQQIRQLAAQTHVQTMRQPSIQIPSPQARQPLAESRPQQIVQPQYQAQAQYPPQPAFVSMSEISAPPPQKRRKSNDGSPLPVMAQLPNKHHAVAKNLVSSSPLSELRTSAIPSSAIPSPRQEPQIDLRNVLLSLADEYLEAAELLKHSSEDGQEYQKLVVTALSCFESVLQNFRHSQPREEARLRLRYAALLFEETTDLEKADEVLVKGIALCEQAKLLDSKYAMQHMLACISFTRNPRAARKAIDKMVTEVETLKLTSWVYCFRLLGATQALQSAENSVALRHINVLSQLAEVKGHAALKILALCLECAVHLRSGTQEGHELAQRSIAGIRSYQLGPEMKQLPQLRTLAVCLAMSCEVSTFILEQMMKTMHVMQTEQDAAGQAKSWNEDGSFLLPLCKSAADGIKEDTSGILATTGSGELALMINWLSKSDMLLLGYTLSGLACMPKNGERGGAEAFLEEAIKICKHRLGRLGGHGLSATRSLQQTHILMLNVKLITASALAARARYDTALTKISEIEQDIEQLDFKLPSVIRARLRLITATCEQGIGQLMKAYRLYLPEIEQIDEKLSPELQEIRTLAILNSIHVIRSLSEDSLPRCEDLLQRVEVYCVTHLNKCFASAYYLVKALIAPPDSLIITTKENLNNALVPSTAAKNKQLLCIVMNCMTEHFFKDIVGGQADKAANAGKTLAEHTGDSLWIAVGTGMLRRTYELSGRLEAAARENELTARAVDQVPENVRRVLKMGIANG